MNKCKKDCKKEGCPLIKGGQGRSNKEVEDLVYTSSWMLIFAILAVGLFFILERVLG